MILRLYSGFEKSLEKRVWMPSGLPSIYKWIEYLDSRFELKIYFTAKDSGSTYQSNWAATRDTRINLDCFNAKISVLAGRKYLGMRLPRKLGMIVRDVRQTAVILCSIVRDRPDVIYFDSANIVPAFLATVFFRTPVVVRVLGACSYWWSVCDSVRPIDRLYRLALRGKFALVIGTDDGSGLDHWFNRVLRKDVDRLTLLNGVEHNDRGVNYEKLNDDLKLIAIKRKSGCKIVLFVSRLEAYKRADLFVRAACEALHQNNASQHYVVVGDGNEREALEKIVTRYNFQQHFSFLGSVAHENIEIVQKLSDIYVSCNADCNLTNTTLEAIASGQCILLPDHSTSKFLDDSTRRYLGDSVIFFSVENGYEGLLAKLKWLMSNDEAINGYRVALRSRSRQILRSWDSRFDQELESILAKVSA